MRRLLFFEAAVLVGVVGQARVIRIHRSHVRIAFQTLLFLNFDMLAAHFIKYRRLSVQFLVFFEFLPRLEALLVLFVRTLTRWLFAEEPLIVLVFGRQRIFRLSAGG